MHFTQTFKSSPHCVPNPDGSLVATLLASKIVIRSVETLDLIRTISLPSEISGPVYAFRWSPSGARLLVALLDQVHVFSSLEKGFHAVVHLVTSINAKPTLVQFGATDDEVCTCFQFGLKFTVANLSSSKSVEIANPKFHHAASAPQGFSFRPLTAHMAMLSRSAGKDWVSIHDPSNRAVQRSWQPDTVDAQSVSWTPDGRWLVVVESSSQGHKALFYTPDGHLYKAWTGPSALVRDAKHYELGAGIKLCHFSSDSKYAALCDYSRSTCILDLKTVTESSRLQHPQNISPKDTIQVWQEQASVGQPSESAHSFVKATQSISPPTGANQSANTTELKSGCASASFDSSSRLLATQLEDAPSTVWIWDTASAELRSVMIFHTNIKLLRWHPHLPELLLITCEGEDYCGLVFVWDPLSEGPRTLSLLARLGTPKLAGKPQVSWLTVQGDADVLMLGDSSQYTFASLTGLAELPTSWQQERSEMLEPSSDLACSQGVMEESYTRPTEEDLSAIDDTFSFRQM